MYGESQVMYEESKVTGYCAWGPWCTFTTIATQFSITKHVALWCCHGTTQHARLQKFNMVANKKYNSRKAVRKQDNT